MENLTNEVVDVVADTTVEAAEEMVTKVGFGTILTGAFALTGVLTGAYFAYKGTKWVCGKVSAGKKSKEDILSAEETEAAKADAQEVESN